MTTHFLIDGTNNNKVVNEFKSIKDALDYLDAKEHTENWQNNWQTFQDYKDEFFTVDSEQMKEAIRTHGNRKRSYWN